MTCPNTATAGFKPFSHLQHPREVIRQFTPNWFAATMGTGVLALALAQLPGRKSRFARDCRSPLAVQYRAVRFIHGAVRGALGAVFR